MNEGTTEDNKSVRDGVRMLTLHNSNEYEIVVELKYIFSFTIHLVYAREYR